jgi:hypothetical protein
MARRTQALLPILAAALSAVACGGDQAKDASTSAPTATESTADTATTTSPDSPDPVGYALDGELLIDSTDGDRVDLAITTWDTDGVACSEPLPAQLEAAEAPAGEPIAAWWTVTLDVSASLCDVPADLFSELGVGAWDAELDVALAQQGLEGATAFGLYLRPANDGPVWLVGVVGTDAQLAGDDLADPSAPLSDDVYALASLVQTPWPAR